MNSTGSTDAAAASTDAGPQVPINNRIGRRWPKYYSKRLINYFTTNFLNTDLVHIDKCVWLHRAVGHSPKLVTVVGRLQHGDILVKILRAVRENCPFCRK